MKPIVRVSVLLFTAAAVLQAGLTAAATEPVRSGAACQTPPLEIWTEPEQWVWKQICEGKTADFNKREKRDDRLDPTTSKGWTESRKLRTVFLEAILLSEPFKSAQTFRGVRIRGAWFTQAINLEHAVIEHALWLEHSRFEKLVKLRRITIKLPLSVTGSTFVKKVDMVGMEARRGLWMDQAEFSEVDLRGTKVGGRLSIAGSTFTGRLHMLSLRVDASLLMSGGKFRKSVDLIFSTVGSNLNVSEAAFETLDLTGTKIGGELRLGSDEESAVAWQGAQRLILLDTKVGVIQDREESWPATLRLELAGFTYNRLGSFKGVANANAIRNRPTHWFIAWLAKDSSYTPQPYEQLADVLRKMGQSAKADEVLYASKERARRELRTKGNWGRWVWATAKWAVIGYGYRFQFSLYWSIGLVLLGATVLRTTGQGPKYGMPFGFFYSLDMLLPFVTLRRFHHSEVALTGFARYYFYVHTLLGYFLASFLVAGLSGLVK